MQDTGERFGEVADSEDNDLFFVRTEDIICLACTNGDSVRRGYLSAKGFGSQLCHLVPEPLKQEPCELWRCTFQLEDAMSVHAMYTYGLSGKKEKKSCTRKILMYGHAVLLRHVATQRLLSCLTSSPSNDKMAYDIGFTQTGSSTVSECHWFTVHPSSNQRSEGEKVRAGDDIFLVSVSNERYLSAGSAFIHSTETDPFVTKAKPPLVQASFNQCVWSLNIVSSGSAKEAAVGFVNGGDVVRFVHRYKNKGCLQVAHRECDVNVKLLVPDKADVSYEKLGDKSHLRSLWRVELFQMRFGGGFTSWGQPFRLKHLVTGKYLGVKESAERGRCEPYVAVPVVRSKSEAGGDVRGGGEPSKRLRVCLLDAINAPKEKTAFCFSKASGIAPQGSMGTALVEGMGTPEVCFGDSEVYLTHITSGKVVGCPVSERRPHSATGLQGAVLCSEIHRMFAFTVTRAQDEEVSAATIIDRTQRVTRSYVHSRRSGLEEEVTQILTELCHYFTPPCRNEVCHEDCQRKQRVMKERQTLFKKQGALQFFLSVIVEMARGKGGSAKVQGLLYKLLAAMIRGNHDNCREFATQRCLRVFMEQLSSPAHTHSVLDVIQCLLTDSPEVLHIITQRDIGSIVKLLHTNGRDAKVMKLLSSLCVCKGVAMRDKQRQIFKHLLACKDLLLHASLKDQVHSVHPSVCVGSKDNSALYSKWYYEVKLTQLRPQDAINTPHFRVGWAHPYHFQPHPSACGRGITDGGIGDDVFSIGFDGQNFWVGGHSLTPPTSKRLVRQSESIACNSPPPDKDTPTISEGDVIGCCLDLDRGVVWFTRNGVRVPGEVVFGHCQDMLTPAVSFSAGISALIALGGHYGNLSHAPPTDYAPLIDAADPTLEVRLLPFQCVGVSDSLTVEGPMVLADYEAFVPAPIVTSNISLPDPLLRSGLKDKLAENIHEVWAKNKIEAGFTFAEARDDKLKHNPSLKAFDDLPERDRQYDYDMALATLSTLVALGYQISTQEDPDRVLPYTELPPDKYRMSNGYIPRPLNLETVTIPKCLRGLVEKLAENAHHVWAAGRISEGWKFGAATNKDRKRNSLLVPYSKLDEATRKSNEDTALESVRTIIALGCTIAPPTDTSGDIRQLTREFSDSHTRIRTFRGQTCYTLTSGKWYYEVKLLTGGMMRVGWATPEFPAGKALGTDKHSFGLDGFLACKWHDGCISFGRRWKAGDVIGCLLDIDSKTMSFTLNGEFLQDAHTESTLAFTDVTSPGGFVPAITLSTGERAQFNFGRSLDAMYHDYSTTGFTPICTPAALPYNLPLWYSSHGGYDTIDHTHPTLSAEGKPRSPGEPDSMISVTLKDWDFSVTPKQECFRLCMGVAFSKDTPTVGQGVERVCFSAIVPSGQDPDHVFVGWTTPEFRYVESQFKPRTDSVPDGDIHVHYGQQIDMIGQSKVGVAHYSTAFMVPLSELIDSPEPLQVLPFSVTVVCVLDFASSRLLFSLQCPPASLLPTNEREVLLSHETKLFPTVVTTPTTGHVVDFDLNPRQDMPSLSQNFFTPFLDAACLDADSAHLPKCPPRFKVQSYNESRWVRQMVQKSRYSVGVASSNHLRLSSDRDTSVSVIMSLPQEEETLNILELSERHALMDFHIQTLDTYSAVCSHSNLELASQVAQHLDSSSLLRYISMAKVAMKYNLMFAYLKLFFALHLNHEVNSRLAMRAEFVIPLSECTQSVLLFPAAMATTTQQQVFQLTQAPLPRTGGGIGGVANQLCHNISSSFSSLPRGESGNVGMALDQFSVEELKNYVFSKLETLLSSRSYRVKLLPSTLSEIFVPLITALDDLLVIGGIQGDDDIQKLLELLDPKLFSSSSQHVDVIRQGLLSEDVACEEPIKVALCNLLHHLCDCQVQHRVESVVTFANGYVEKLQEEQDQRYQKYFRSKPREFRCPPEMQLQAMLTQKPSPGQSHLHDSLTTFHRQLQDHCGGSQVKGQPFKSLSTSQKLAQLVALINSSDECDSHGNKSSHVTSLRELITITMVKWAESEIKDSNLISQIFSLLHRQFDELKEVSEALKRTYVIDLTGEKVRQELAEFIHALGSLRLLLNVGMGKSEETSMKDFLSTIQQSQLFYCHPHLLRQLGVHTTVLGLIRAYLGISRGPSDKRSTSFHKKHLRSKSHGAPPPVEDCCRFLCKFARISQENQRVLFCHIGYLLEHMEKYPELMFSSGCTPLDVATATIKDNQELALALEESQLENVVQLLVSITTSFRGSQDLTDVAPSNNLGMVHSSSFSLNFEWNPRVGGKCLEFLQCAVWVDNEQIQENAYSVVRLLIRHSECMGPALAGEALGLYTVYKEAIDKLEPEPAVFADISSTSGLEGLNDSFSTSSSSLFSRQSTIFNASSLSTKCVLTFYTSLVRLLASCAPHMTGHTPCRSNMLNKRKEGSDQRTLNILRNLVKIDDIINILSLPYASETEPGVRPTHKRAVVWFLARVYKISDPEILLNLLSKALLPDIKLTLKVSAKGEEGRYFSRALNRYMCSSVLPLLTRCASLFKSLLSHLHLLDNFIGCCIQLYTTVSLSSGQLDCIADFLISYTRELHPRVLQRFIPKIIAQLHCVGLSTTVHCKFLATHYTRFARYYQSGAVDKSYLGHAHQDEKVSAALVIHRLLDALASNLPEDGQILRHAVSCIKAASCALSPNCLVPLRERYSSLYPSSPRTYEPCPLNTSSIPLTTVHKELIGQYASYRHDCWVYDQQSDGWGFGEEVDQDKLKHPNMKPFSNLSEEEQRERSAQVEAVVKALLLKGYSLTKLNTLDTHTKTYKPRKVCMRRPKKSTVGVVSPWAETPYEPEVLDLSRIELRVDHRFIAEVLAEDMHEHWALKQKQTCPDCHDNQSFLPYVLLEEGRKEELRSYVFDLLRFFRVLGYEANNTHRSTSSSPDESRSSKDKFGMQLFDKALSLLSSSAHSFHVQVLFPVLTAFLSHHAPYFMPPTGGHRGHSFASKPEKAKILRMFCQVMEYTRHNLSDLFLSITTPPRVLGESPQDGSDSEGDNNWATVSCILSLVRSLVRAMDISGVLGEGEELETEHPEVVTFFRQAVSGVHLTTKNLTKLDKLDARFHFYCLHVLTPALGALFSHLGSHGSGGLLITGPVHTHCQYIFKSLVKMASDAGPVYVGSSPLITIGQCMGSFALAFPDPFLENETFGFTLPSLLNELHKATVEGVTCGNVLFVVDIIVPVLTSYLCRWLNTPQREAAENSVTIETVDEVVGAILLLLEGHFNMRRISWFPRILDGALLLAGKCSLEILTGQLVEIVTMLRERAIVLWKEEQYASASWSQGLVEEEGVADHTHFITENYRLFTRDVSSVLSFLSVYLHTHSTTLRPHTPTPSHNPCEEATEAINNLFVSLADIFHCWSSSQIFKREFQTATFTLAEQCRQFQLCRQLSQPWAGPHHPPQSKKPPNLLLVCLELLLPLSDQGLSMEDREMVNLVKEKLGKKKVVADDLKEELVQELTARETKGQPLARQLVRKVSQRLLLVTPERGVEDRALKILSTAKVRHKLEQVDRCHIAQSRWRQLFSQRKRKAIVKCFLAVPYFKVKKHRAINMFLEQYCVSWLSGSDHSTHLRLTEELLDKQDYHALQRSHDKSRDQERAVTRMDPLTQLFTMFRRVAASNQCVNSSLFTAYAELLSKSVVGHEEEELDEDDHATKAYELYSQHKADLVCKQGQLADRGAHSMVLLVISATQGEASPLVHATLKLGIAMLKEGNKRVQEEMLSELRGMDVGFLFSIASFISSCGVLDWNAYQRFNKSEAVTSSSSSVCRVFPQAGFISSLFRFLQLLCEGHNQSFQDYLRTQAGNTTTVNIVVCTVDYLLRLQESISDFYWHYSDYPIIDLQGRENFLKAFKVAKQVVRTLTEYTQGPCVRNQECLARSRLWDAVTGFLHIFAVLQRKLYRETSQVELLRELLGLQEELFILLLSLLEGSTMSSNIGRLMLDMLLESSTHIQDIAQFFLIFVKLKDAITSKAFREYDLNKDGFISYREFEKAMEAQQRYTKEEIAYLMECADLNKDGLLDYMEFTERFHQPAKSIGLHLCVLVVNLCDLLPSDPRLSTFKQIPQLKELMTHFERNMGCIEILGKSGRVERVYFEVQESRRRQWKETQSIQESRVSFLHSVEMSSQKNKLKGFVSFCEDAIFEMDQADKISGSEQLAMESRASQHRRAHNIVRTPGAFLSSVRARVSALSQNNSRLTRCVTSVCSVIMWVWLLIVWVMGSVRDSVRRGFHAVRHRLRPQPTITVSTPPTNLSGRRPAKLTISTGVKGHDRSQRAQTTTQEYPSPPRGGVAFLRRPTAPNVANGAESAVKSEYKRLLSHDVRRGSLSPSPHLHSSHTVTLSYDRSRMKRPSMSADTPTPEGLLRDKGDDYVPGITMATRSWSSRLAKHYYNLNTCKFVLTFLINIILLTFKVSSFDHTYNAPPIPVENGTEYELQDMFWGPLLLESLALLHFAVSVILIPSYWYLKIPLIIFKREKEVARKLELKQLWVSEEPEGLRDRWDWLAVTSHTFPRNYFDKQVKRRVCESQGPGKVKERSTRLGILTHSTFERRTKFERVMEMCHSLCDVKYYVWMFGVTISDMVIQYQTLYCIVSFVGLKWNVFFFSLHLLDLVMSFKLLQTVLRSVLNNYKQLAMTVLMTCVVIYIYTVIAFNFFRKFYRQTTSEGLPVKTCDSMFRCFIYHIDQGLRSGGGIADVLEPASGDPNEFTRLFFDITFFFVVIIILLAIIQGLIIDSFGELRDREETLANEMATKCFICGQTKSTFERVPHGFERHISREHNMAHYMFFLLYLIKKRESEFSGQESYVWEMYLKQDWDFFPVGDSFKAQVDSRSPTPLPGGSGWSKSEGGGSPFVQSSPALVRRSQTSPLSN